MRTSESPATLVVVWIQGDGTVNTVKRREENDTPILEARSVAHVLNVLGWRRRIVEDGLDFREE